MTKLYRALSIHLLLKGLLYGRLAAPLTIEEILQQRGQPNWKSTMTQWTEYVYISILCCISRQNSEGRRYRGLARRTSILRRGHRTVHTTADHASCVMGSSNVICGDSESMLEEGRVRPHVSVVIIRESNART